MEQRLTMITLGVNDLIAATQFYENAFGWEKSSFSNEHVTFFLLNGIQLSLYGKTALAEDAKVSPEGNGFNGFTLCYNARTVEEVDQLISQLKDAGVAIAKFPEKVHWGGYSGYVNDLDGNLWEIAYNPYLQLDAAGNCLN